MKNSTLSGELLVAIATFCFASLSCKQGPSVGNFLEQKQDRESAYSNAVPEVKTAISKNEPVFIPIAVPKSKRERFKGKKSASELTQEEKNELERETLELAPVRRQIDYVIYFEKDWKEADSKVRALLEANGHLTNAFVNEQVTASKMLTYRLLSGELSPEKKQAIAYYTELLLRNAHPDAHLIHRCLAALKGTWSTERIEGSAHEASIFAREYLQQNPCRPCIEQTGVSEKMIDAQQLRLYQIHGAITKLNALTRAQ